MKLFIVLSLSVHNMDIVSVDGYLDSIPILKSVNRKIESSLDEDEFPFYELFNKTDMFFLVAIHTYPSR